MKLIPTNFYITVLTTWANDGQNPQPREEGTSSVITFVDASLFVRTSPVSDNAAAELLSFLLAELWPSPTKATGFFSFVPNQC